MEPHYLFQTLLFRLQLFPLLPNLVRPPIVLEQCISYLEEFVMERDRQGIDPRFGKVPPSLDVYQFVWDRTRMIRKDFILQIIQANLRTIVAYAALWLFVATNGLLGGT